MAEFAMDGRYNIDYFLKHEGGIGPKNLTDFTLCVRFNINYLRPYGLFSYATFLDDDSLAMGFRIRAKSLYLCVWKYFWRKYSQNGEKCKKMENFKVQNEWHHVCLSYKTEIFSSDVVNITSKLYYNGKLVEGGKVFTYLVIL